MILFWICVFIVAVLVEAATLSLVSIWFGVGALGAAIAAIFGANLPVQLIVFIVISIILLIFTRPLIKKMMPTKPIPTNYELDIGKQAKVIETIDNDKNTGRVTLNGVDWNATSEDGSVIQKDTIVVVKKVGTTTLVVSINKD